MTEFVACFMLKKSSVIKKRKQKCCKVKKKKELECIVSLCILHENTKPVKDVDCHINYFGIENRNTKERTRTEGSVVLCGSEIHHKTQNLSLIGNQNGFKQIL